jgi:hypothetical protein
MLAADLLDAGGQGFTGGQIFSGGQGFTGGHSGFGVTGLSDLHAAMRKMAKNRNFICPPTSEIRNSYTWFVEDKKATARSV